MVVLNKIKASTLIETLVATILIVIIFMVSSMVLNNLFANNIKFNTQKIENELNELEYTIQTEQIKLPYTIDYNDWQVSALKTQIQTIQTVVIEAKHKETEKLIKRTVAIETEH
jgi:hypothetical protein